MRVYERFRVRMRVRVRATIENAWLVHTHVVHPLFLKATHMSAWI